MEIDFTALVRDTLMDVYVGHRGELPEGEFTPSIEVAATLRSAFPEPEKMVVFLRDAMFAHMSRTEVTRTPFYINTVLFAESSIEYMEKHKTHLRSFYGAATEAKAFESGVYASVLGSEQDYIDVFGTKFLRTGAHNFDAGLLLPSVWWMIWSVEFGRFGVNDLPELWLKQVIRQAGNKYVAENLFHSERAKLKKTLARRRVCEKAAKSAIYQVALGWAVRQHVVRIIYDDSGGCTPASDSRLSLDCLHANTPLIDRDLILFKSVLDLVPPPCNLPVQRLGKRYEEIHPIELAVMAEEVERTNDA